MPRIVRYQGAIVRDHHILLIKHTNHADGRSYWVVPGGGIEPGETEEACVQREMREETNLHVMVERLILENADIPSGTYQRRKTYLCTVLDGEAMPGYEPEEDAANTYAITEVGWFDLCDAGTWDELVVGDWVTYRLLQHIQGALGYPVAPDRDNRSVA